MIWAAIIIELARQDWVDFAILAILQFINGFLGWHEERNAGNAIEALKQRLAPKACVKRDNEFIIIDAKALVIGDRIKIKLGDIVPADALLGPGFCEVDQAALTGESMAVTKYEGDEVFQGSVIKRGDLEAVVSATGRNTFFGKTSTLVASVNQRSSFQKILFKVAMFLLGLASLCAIIILVVVSLKGNNFLETLGICVVLMVASIPIAMQLVSTTTMAVGAHALARRQAIVSRLSSIESLAGMEILCSDKTGTLTKNILTVQVPRALGGISDKEIFTVAGLASKRESGNQDAIDKCISDYSADQCGIKFDAWEEEDFIPFDPKIKRTEATVRVKKTGDSFKCTKGAPQVILALCNNPSIEEEVATMVQELAAGGYRTIGVARTVEGKWQMMGLIPLYDPPRDDTLETIKKARDMQVSVKMITGDQLAIAKETAKLLNLGDRIYNSDMLSEKSSPLERELLDQVLLEADGFAEVFPEHKFAIVKMIQDRGKRCGMTGDGVNDAPALKVADVGIAVEGATDAARAAADIVLASPGLSVIIEAIYRARKVFQRIKNYMIYRIATTLQILLFFFVSMVAINPKNFTCAGHHGCDDTPNTFTLPVTGLVLITILNDGTIISIAYDKVTVNKEPEKWNLNVVFIISTVLGFLTFISALVLLVVGLDHMDSAHPNTVMHAFGVHTWSYGQLQTIIWSKVALQGYANVFSARTDNFFWCRIPGKFMMSAVGFAIVVTFLLTPFWFLNLKAGTGDSGSSIPDMEGASWGATGFVSIYCIICFLAFDLVKVGCYWGIRTYYTMQSPDKREYTGQFLTDSFLVFTTGYDVRNRRKTLVTRRSMLAVEESMEMKHDKPGR